MRKTKRSILGAMLLAFALIMAACTNDDESGGEEPETGSGELSGNVRIWTHQNDAFNDGLQALADSFAAENPGVTFEFETFDYDTYIQTLQTSLPAGTEADVLQVFGSWTCSYADNLAPVPESVLTTADADSAFFEAALDGYKCDDQLYGMPQEFNIEYGATLVNTELAEAAGLGDLSEGWDDWDAFTADAQKLSEGGEGDMTRAGFMFTTADALPYTFYSMIVQQGGSYLSEDGSAFTINTPEGKAALEQMTSFVEAGLVDPVLYNDEANWVGDCFFATTCAMGVVGPWVVADYKDDFPEVAAAATYAPLPSMGDEPNFVADSGWGLTVSNRSEVSDAAWAFVQYAALDAENALEWNAAAGTLPALRANAEGDAATTLVEGFPQFGPFLDILGSGQFVGELPDRDLLWYDITYPHILSALQGNESIDDALAAMEREANETIGG